MGSTTRKLFVWLVSLTAVVAVYLLVTQRSKSPRIKIETAEKLPHTAADSNVGQFGGEVGMVGDVGVKAVQRARYTHLNKDKQIDREFGFEKLLHEIGDEWELEKPFMNVFRRGFTCYITADKGRVQVETAAGRPSPKDATFTGNVVIHIVPRSGSSIKQSTIYFDDIAFLSEKSMLSTAGPVRYVSQDARMRGRGLELIYDDQLDRVEFLKIHHLEKLTLKQSPERSLLSKKTQGRTHPSESVVPDVTKETKPVPPPVSQPAPEPVPPASREVVERDENRRYKCVFRKNVVIDSPEQLIFADEVSIDDILFSKDSGEESEQPVTPTDDDTKTSRKIPEESGAVAGDSASAAAGDTKGDDVAVAEPGEPNELIVVTCDNGIVAYPMDAPEAQKSSAKTESMTVATYKPGPKDLDAAGGRTTFVAKGINYNTVTGDTCASGSSELTFYVDDVMTGEPAEAIVPVNVTAEEKAEFFPALNQVTFEDNCVCSMYRDDPNGRQKYVLSAPKLVVNLASDTAERSSASAGAIEHLTADGGTVRLSTVKTAAQKLLAGVELKCSKFDFDAGQQMFLAAGPGLIKVDNSNAAEDKTSSNRFSLRKKCYAVMRDFETLKYFSKSNRLVADATGQTVLIDYFPIVEGQYGRQVSVTAGHIDALFYDAGGGQTELSTLSASGGITYKDADKQFAGSKLFYDADTSVMTVQGDASQPCLLNGALVDGIEYDLRTGRTKARIKGRGILRPKKITRRRTNR